jgi:glycosyltransferase involved in cell wall biosynthesis
VAVRIALQIDQLGFSVPGGIGTYVARLLETIPLVDPDADVVPFHAPFVRPPPVSGGGWGVQVRTPLRLLYPAWSYTGWPPLPGPLRRCSVVHVTNPAGVAPARRGQALVVTVHDLAFEHLPGSFSPRWRALYRAGLRATARRADAVLTPSRSTADDVVERTGIDASKVHVTPLAATSPLPPSADAAERLERIGVTAPYLLFVGTIEERKNLVRLIRAYRALAAEGLPHSLVLNGRAGFGADAVAAEIGAGGRGRIVRTSNLDDAGLGDLYRGADAFVYPSRYEGFGLPVLEAMQRGVPVVASNSSSLPEVAGDAALLVDPEDDGALTDALRRVLTDLSLREDLARRGPAQAARFSWQATARATLAAYATAHRSADGSRHGPPRRTPEEGS